MKFLIGFILFFVLLYMLTKPIREIIKAVTGQPGGNQDPTRRNTGPRTPADKASSNEAKGDIVPDGAGEYVDFEEVKEEKK